MQGFLLIKIRGHNCTSFPLLKFWLIRYFWQCFLKAAFDYSTSICPACLIFFPIEIFVKQDFNETIILNNRWECCKIINNDGWLVGIGYILLTSKDVFQSNCNFNWNHNIAFIVIIWLYTWSPINLIFKRAN